MKGLRKIKKVREAIKVWYERNEANISAVAGIIALVVLMLMAEPVA